MGGCLSICHRDSNLPAIAPQFCSLETPAVSVLIPVKAEPPAKGRWLRQTAFDSLLLATTSSWREKLNVLAGKQYSLVSLFVYSSDFSHAVAVHSAGTAAHLAPPGLVLAACSGSSHALMLENKKPVVHNHAAPLEPLPLDWFSLEGCEDADSFLLLPLHRAGPIYGSVLVCVNEGDSCSYTGTCGDDRRVVQYEMEELELMSQYLSMGLLTSATDLEMLQVVANAATLVQRSLTIQGAVACLTEAVQACLRLRTRLELECLPAVAFRSCHAAAFFRALPGPNHHSQDILAAQRHALLLQHQQHAAGGYGGGGEGGGLAAGVLHSQSRTLGSTKWFIDDGGTGLGPPPGSCSLVASAASLHGGAAAVQLDQGLAFIDRDAAGAGAAAALSHQLLQQQQQRALLQGGALGSGGGGNIRGRLAPSAWLIGPRDSLEPTGTQSPRGTLSLPLMAAVAPGTKVRATATLLHQTLLAQQLELLATADGGGGREGNGTGSTSNSTSDHAVRGLGGGPAAGSRGAASAAGLRAPAAGRSRVLAQSPDAVVSALAGRVGGGSGGGGWVGGSEAAAAAASAAAAAAVSRRPVSAAVVPNCATFLMADERQPYKDVLHVQRMLPQVRAHSLVLVVGGALERPQLQYGSNDSQLTRGSMAPGGAPPVADAASIAAAIATNPINSVKLQQQLLQQRLFPNAVCGGTALSHGSADTTPDPFKFSSESGRASGAPPTAAALLTAGTLSSAALNRTMGAGSAVHGAAQMDGAAACPPASLALYLVSSESVPRVILEQVAEEAHQLVQVLLRPLACAVTGPTLAAEWARFTLMVLGKVASAGGGAAAAAAAAAAGSGGGGVSVSCASARPPSLLASMSHMHSGIIDPGSQSHVSADITCDDTTTVSIAFDGGANANTGTLSMMISSMRDVLSTVQLERTPDFRNATLEDIYAVRLLKVIGRGGQGMVFQGQMYNTVVAVKIIPSSDDVEATGAAAQASAGAAGGADAGGAGAPHADSSEAAQKLQQRQKRWLVRDALEVAVTSTISHPHIVQVLNFFTDALVVEYSNEHGRYRLMPREDSPNAKGASNTAIVMEYCDAGTLKHAVDNGCFRLHRSGGPVLTASGAGASASAVGIPAVDSGAGAARAASNASGAIAGGGSLAAAAAALAASTSALQHGNMVALLTSLLEVAAGLRHLHENRLVHCDIKPSNVLLRSCTADVRGWVCKLSDFGCVRLMNAVDPATGRPAFHSLSPVGSLSYMAPESMFRDTFLDSSIDIYSFGIMMWECAMGQVPYSGVPAQQLPSLVRRGLRPSFHNNLPQEYRQIACMCWAQDPRRRPTAAALVQLLQRMLSRTFEEADAHEALLQQQPQQQQPQQQPQPQAHLQLAQGQAPALAHASPTGSRKPLPSPSAVAAAAAGAADLGPAARPHSALRPQLQSSYPLPAAVASPLRFHQGISSQASAHATSQLEGAASAAAAAAGAAAAARKMSPGTAVATPAAAATSSRFSVAIVPPAAQPAGAAAAAAAKREAESPEAGGARKTAAAVAAAAAEAPTSIVLVNAATVASPRSVLAGVSGAAPSPVATAAAAAAGAAAGGGSPLGPLALLPTQQQQQQQQPSPLGAATRVKPAA